MSQPPAIVVEALTKHFAEAGRPVVDSASFAVEQGQFVVLLGPSGCGKTTLLKMINRLIEPTSGRIMVEGNDVLHMPATRLRRRIGYVIQQTGLFPHMRVEANIAVVPRLLRWDRRRIDARVVELLDLVGLPLDYRRRYPRQLSGGEQQRVGIARALAADPAIMLMDEPFGAIDAITRARLQVELRSLQRKLHKTILFVTHDVDEALRLADKILIMRKGQIVQFDAPLEILMHPADDFVASLVDSGDVLRRLSLLPVASITHADRAAEGRHARASIAADADLRTALALMLSRGETVLNVLDETGARRGTLSLDDLRQVVGQPAGPVISGAA